VTPKKKAEKRKKMMGFFHNNEKKRDNIAEIPIVSDLYYPCLSWKSGLRSTSM
jgi:hypothetical protein